MAIEIRSYNTCSINDYGSCEKKLVTIKFKKAIFGFYIILKIFL